MADNNQEVLTGRTSPRTKFEGQPLTNASGIPVPSNLTFPVKCFGQAASLHKGHVILTNHARELGFQWESYDDVRDSSPDKQQLPLPNQRLK